MDSSLTNAAAAKALQSVAHCGAIAVQDAADNLRNLMTITTTAIGVAMAEYITTKDPFYMHVVSHAQSIVASATQHLTEVGSAAADVIKNFPTGSSS